MYRHIRRQPLPKSPLLARMLKHLTPWMMADVFVIGTLVSMIKIIGMAEVELGLSFWTLCGYALLLLFTSQSVDRDWLWAIARLQKHRTNQRPSAVKPPLRKDSLAATPAA